MAEKWVLGVANDGEASDGVASDGEAADPGAGDGDASDSRAGIGIAGDGEDAGGELVIARLVIFFTLVVSLILQVQCILGSSIVACFLENMGN
jgi:hypothetical protein